MARMSAERIGNVKMKEGAIRETSVRVCICEYIRERRKENKIDRKRIKEQERERGRKCVLMFVKSYRSEF